MVEGGANDKPESLVLGGLRIAVEQLAKINQLQVELAKVAGKKTD